MVARVVSWSWARHAARALTSAASAPTQVIRQMFRNMNSSGPLSPRSTGRLSSLTTPMVAAITKNSSVGRWLSEARKPTPVTRIAATDSGT